MLLTFTQRRPHYTTHTSSRAASSLFLKFYALPRTPRISTHPSVHPSTRTRIRRLQRCRSSSRFVVRVYYARRCQPTATSPPFRFLASGWRICDVPARLPSRQRYAALFRSLPQARACRSRQGSSGSRSYICEYIHHLHCTVYVRTS